MLALLLALNMQQAPVIITEPWAPIEDIDCNQPQTSSEDIEGCQAMEEGE